MSVWSRINHSNILNYTFCITKADKPTVELCFNEIASNKTKDALRWLETVSGSFQDLDFDGSF